MVDEVQSYTQLVTECQEMGSVVAQMRTPTTLHVDMRDMDNCWHWKIALDALLRAIPKRHGETPILFVYVQLSREKVQICLQVLVLVVLETGYILDQLK